jgi:membrane protease YdiL (CAAX protease family)
MHELNARQNNLSKLGIWGTLAAMLMSTGLCTVIFGAFLSCLFVENASANALKWSNSLMQLGILFVPALCVGFLVDKSRPLAYLRLGKGFRLTDVGFMVLIAVAGLPLVNLLTAWNESLHLPAVLSEVEIWMRTKEEETGQMIRFLLSGAEASVLIVNLTTIAILPALFEEIFYRGLFLQWAILLSKRSWLAVLLTAVVFSAVHLQFLGFFPRLLYGVYLGYLVVRTGSLWTAVLAHFFNNAVVVSAAYLYERGVVETDYSQPVDCLQNPLLLILSVSVLICTVIVYDRFRQRDASS